MHFGEQYDFFANISISKNGEILFRQIGHSNFGDYFNRFFMHYLQKV